MKRILFTIIAAAALFSGTAQSLKTFYIVFPVNADTTVNKIFVSDFEPANSENNILSKYGEALSSGIKGQIKSGTRYGDVNLIPQTWRRTDIYQVADNETDAQWVLTGTYDVQTESSRDKKTEIKKEKGSSGKYIIPYEMVYYDYMNSTNTKVKMELKDKQGNVIVAYEKEKAGESHPKRDLRDPTSKLKSHAELAGASQQFFVVDLANQFLPWFKPFVYEFQNIKNRDIKDKVSKDRFRELRKMLRDDKDLAGDRDYKGLIKLYKTVAEETELEPAFVNLAYVYEVLGDYSNAHKIYDDLGRSKDAERVDVFVSERDKLKAFGKN